MKSLRSIKVSASRSAKKSKINQLIYNQSSLIEEIGNHHEEYPVEQIDDIEGEDIRHLDINGHYNWYGNDRNDIGEDNERPDHMQDDNDNEDDNIEIDPVS